MNENSRNMKSLAALWIVALLLAACSPAASRPQQVIQTVEISKEGDQGNVQGTAQQPALPPVQVEEPQAGLQTAPPAEIGQPPSPLPSSGTYSDPKLMPAPTQAAGSLVMPVAPPPMDNTFQSYGVNPFEDPREDNLSTFALDVDTASYSVARRYVSDGNLPPAEAVRVEEFINYFNAGYPAPIEVPFALYADGAPSPFHRDGSIILRFGIQGHQIAESERKPASLTFVVDISGSMDMENRLGLVKQSLQLLVDQLRPTDTVSIVVYGSNAWVLLTPTSGEDKNRILEAIYSMHTDGATNAEAGLRLGYQLAYQAYRPNAINRVILCSDGVANVGATGPEQILESIRGYADTGITLTSVGFGMGNFNDVLMEQLADNGDGSYAYIDDLDEARKLFVEDLTSTLQVIARDAKVQVDFNPLVVARYRLIGYENRAVADQDFRNDSVDAGEIGSGHSVTALYAVLLQPGAQGRIATLQLRWQEPETAVVHEINGNFNTFDLSQSFENAAPRYQLAVSAAQYAELLRLSPWAAGSSIGQVLQHVVRISGFLPRDEEVAELVTLVSRASQIQRLVEWQ